MLKRIIFDLDNTIFDSITDYINTYNEFLDSSDITFSIEELALVTKEYEKDNYNVNKIEYTSYVSEKLNIDYSVNNFNKILEINGKHATIINSNTKKILEYLNSKYEIVALSNWYYDVQYKRLEKRGLLKYFKHIYCLDNFGSKPSSAVFEKACKPYELNECLIIGDSIKNDIEVPKKLGMKVIYFNPKNYHSTYDNINSLDELLNKL